MTRRKSLAPSEDKAREQARIEAEAHKPLDCEKEERFAQAYAASFDGPASAREAGYGKEAEANWEELLDCPKVQARLRAPRQGPHVPPQVASAIFSRLKELAFADYSNLYVQDPITGEVRLEPSCATPEQLNMLKIRATTIRRGSVTQTTTTVEPPSRDKALDLVVQRMGLKVALPADGDGDAFGRAIDQLLRGGGGTFPINEKDDPDFFPDGLTDDGPGS